MKRLEFYKPNKSNTGACVTLQFQIETEDPKKNGLYLNILKQATWNPETKNGSFKENVNNPEKHKKVKITETEIGSILNVIKSAGSTKFSTVHSRNGVNTQIFFEPYIKDDVMLGFIIRVSNLSIALNMGEATLLEEYLKLGVHKLYA